MKKLLRVSWLAWKNGALPAVCKDVLLAGFILAGVQMTDGALGLIIRMFIEMVLD